MTEEIEDLHSLAEECREWGRPADDAGKATPHVRACETEFNRLATALDIIANRITVLKKQNDNLNLMLGYAIGQMITAGIAPEEPIVQYLKDRGLMK